MPKLSPIRSLTPAATASPRGFALPRERELSPVFQPLADLRTAELVGYEGLIRGPVGTRYVAPQALMQLGRELGRVSELELACCHRQVEAFARMRLPGSLWLNLGGQVLVDLYHESRHNLQFLFETGLPADRIVLEITEHDHLQQPEALADVLRQLRQSGLRFALDDFGDGRSSLRLWAELQPEFVKIDRYFISEIHRSPEKFATVKALTRLADTFGTELLAEGIESEAELAVVRDLGIAYGQGFLFAHPCAEPLREFEPAIVHALKSRGIAVYPEAVRSPFRQALVGPLARRVPPVSPELQTEDLLRLFREQTDLQLLAVVANGRPIGLINRRSFMDRYAQPFQRELHGRRACTAFMNPHPVLVDKSTSLDALTRLLTDGEDRVLAEGFVITESDRYFGVGTGEALFRALTEIRIAAARYANPLTFLPGNIPISEHVTRLLASGASFAACYCDLDHFKPFNDHYGYKRGDSMIQLAAQILTAQADGLRDFVGHVGGDDFIVLFQSADWRERARASIETFNAEARRLFRDSDLAAGYLYGHDRNGQPTRFPFTTLSIGAVEVGPGRYRSHEEVASAAAGAKSQAKQLRGGFYEAPHDAGT